MVIGGLSSGINGKENTPDTQLLQRFAAEEGYHLLLCHHPEYYVPHVKPTGIELTVCGHAHGGQWRFFGIAVYAPGQGLFPRYTSGVLEDRCVISRGIGDHTWIPRIGNRRELIIIEPGFND
jgi:predicted MPP superfamily phosphohydrolase